MAVYGTTQEITAGRQSLEPPQKGPENSHWTAFTGLLWQTLLELWEEARSYYKRPIEDLLYRRPVQGMGMDYILQDEYWI